MKFYIYRPLNATHGAGAEFNLHVFPILKGLDRNGIVLAVDISKSTSCYDSFVSPGCNANWFSDVFQQPFEQVTSPADAADIRATFEKVRDEGYADLPTRVTVFHNRPFSAFKDSPTLLGHREPGDPRHGGSKNGLRQSAVEECRALVSKYLTWQQGFKALLANIISGNESYIGDSTLALHVRLRDKKHMEAPSNNKLTVVEVVEKSQMLMHHLSCTNVFLCTDDGEKKKELIQDFSNQNIICVVFPARLGTADSVGLHFDRDVPPDAKCMDFWAEVYLMSRCRGLLATRSNVAGLVASFSTALPWYFSDFWGHEFELGTSGSSSSRAPGVTAAASATTGDDDVRFFLGRCGQTYRRWFLSGA